MTQLFNRDGTEFNGTPDRSPEGKPVHMVAVSCDRCCVVNGQRLWIMGLENGRPYSHTGFDCWTCGNTGIRRFRTERLYTEVELARVNKSAATRAARKVEAHRIAVEKAERQQAEALAAFVAANEGFCQQLSQLQGEFWDGFRDSFYKRLQAPTERQIALVEGEVAKLQQNATSEHFGTVGERVEIKGTMEKVVSIQSHYGIKFINIIRCESGNVAVHMGSYICDKGESVHIKATIAQHNVRDGVKQTIIQRPKNI